jgi:hypothetical protein
MKQIAIFLTLVLAASTAQAVTTHYCISGGSQTTTTSSTTAWTFSGGTCSNLGSTCGSLQAAMNNCAAGDTLYIAGSFNIALALTQSNAGTITAPTRMIGCNSTTGSADGTLCYITGGTAVTTDLITTAQNYWRFDNLGMVANSAAEIILEAAARESLWVNCQFSETDGLQDVNGFSASANDQLVNCEFANLAAAFGSVSSVQCINTSFHGLKSSIPLAANSGNLFAGCLWYSDTNTCIGTGPVSQLAVVGCTLVGSGTGSLAAINSAGHVLIVNTRITNFGTAVLGAGINQINNWEGGNGALGSGTLNSDFCSNSATTITTTGNLGFSNSATGSGLQLTPTATGYYITTGLKTTTGSDQCTFVGTEGVFAAQNPATYSTSAAAILSGSYAAAGGTLGTYTPATITLSSGGTFTPGSGFNFALSGDTQSLAGSWPTPTGGTLFSGTNPFPNYVLNTASTADIGGTNFSGSATLPPTNQYYGTFGIAGTTAGLISGAFTNGSAFSVTASNVLYGYQVPSGANNDVIGTLGQYWTMSSGTQLLNGIVGGGSLGTSYTGSATATASQIASGQVVLGVSGTNTGQGFNSILGLTGTATEAYVESGGTYMLLGNTYTGTLSGGTGGGVTVTIGGVSYSGSALWLTGGTGDLTGSGSGTLTSSGTTSGGWYIGGLGISGTNASNAVSGTRLGPSGSIYGSFFPHWPTQATAIKSKKITIRPDGTIILEDK